MSFPCLRCLVYLSLFLLCFFVSETCPKTTTTFGIWAVVRLLFLWSVFSLFYLFCATIRYQLEMHGEVVIVRFLVAIEAHLRVMHPLAAWDDWFDPVTHRPQLIASSLSRQPCSLGQPKEDKKLADKWRLSSASIRCECLSAAPLRQKLVKDKEAYSSVAL